MGFQPALSGILAGEIEAKQEKSVRQDAKRSRQDARAPADAEILMRLVALNSERAIEEAAGKTR